MDLSTSLSSQMNPMKTLFSTLLFALVLSASAQDLKITYIANEGVLLEGGGQKVLIDALFDDFYEAYLSPSEAVMADMKASARPFNNVALTLTTHVHRDHFEAKTAGDFIKAHQETQFLSTEEVVTELKSKYDTKSFEDRVSGKRRIIEKMSDTFNGITVHSFFINHAGTRSAAIENLGFIIEIGGKKVLHLGDSDMDIERYSALNLSQYKLDVVLVPYWYMSSDDGREILDNHIKAKSLIGIHYPKAPSPAALEAISTNYPSARVFQKTLTEVQY